MLHLVNRPTPVRRVLCGRQSGGRQISNRASLVAFPLQACSSRFPCGLGHSACLLECFGAFGSRSDGSLPSQEPHNLRMRSKQGNKVAANHEYIVGCAIHLD